jgi:hypothetical protein
MHRFEFYDLGVAQVLNGLFGIEGTENMTVLLILLLQTQRIAADVKRKREQYVNYNILPLYTVGVKPAIMELPEVVHGHDMSFYSSATLFSRNTIFLSCSLPYPHTFPEKY